VVDVAAGLPETVSPVQAEQAGDGVSVYPVIGPEAEVGAVQETESCPAVLVDKVDGAVGVAGMPTTAAVEAADAALLPLALVAIKVKV
jgi:hypothetical protein